jgi:hypothetical protein
MMSLVDGLVNFRKIINGYYLVTQHFYFLKSRSRSTRFRFYVMQECRADSYQEQVEPTLWMMWRLTPVGDDPVALASVDNLAPS